MSIEINIRRPGVLPRLALREQTVVDYQPSVLLLAVPALVALVQRRRRGRAAGGGASQQAGTTTRTARMIMTGGVECVREGESVLDAARTMDRLGVGALPICGADDRLKGMLTDRDIVVKVLARGLDPASTLAGELGQGKPVTIGADDSLQELVRTMAEHQVKRLPVIDGHRLVGVVSESDVAEHATPQQLVAVVRGVYADD